MFSLKCTYYTKEFETINELVADVIRLGMDLDYEITMDGVGIGEKLIDLIYF